MAKKILILEDNADRRAEMQRCLQDRFYQFEVVFFDAPGPMRDYLDRHLSEAIIIDLDHDLDLLPGPNGRCTDPGTGRDIANYLSTKDPACPVVIHTSNGRAGDGMEIALQESDWQTYRVVPADDLAWIATTWFRTIRNAIVGKKHKAPM